MTVPRRCFFCGSFFIFFIFRVCHAFVSVHCSLVATCLERANLLALLCVMFYCVFVTFPCGVLGQVWYLIVSIPDLCLLPFSKRLYSILKLFFSDARWNIQYSKSNSHHKRPQIIEPWHKISNNVVCATSKGSDQPAHTRRLIRAFASRLNIL